MVNAIKARMNRTLISAVMSSLLYQLSYSLIRKRDVPDKVKRSLLCADKGFEPLYAGHEPVMLLLHQPAFLYYKAPSLRR